MWTIHIFRTRNTTKVFKMLYKMSLSVSEIPPLFVELSELHRNENKSYDFWKEKAR